MRRWTTTSGSTQSSGRSSCTTSTQSSTALRCSPKEPHPWTASSTFVARVCVGFRTASSTGCPPTEASWSSACYTLDATHRLLWKASAADSLDLGLSDSSAHDGWSLLDEDGRGLFEQDLPHIAAQIFPAPRQRLWRPPPSATDLVRRSRSRSMSPASFLTSPRLGRHFAQLRSRTAVVPAPVLQGSKRTARGFTGRRPRGAVPTRCTPRGCPKHHGNHWPATDLRPRWSANPRRSRGRLGRRSRSR